MEFYELNRLYDETLKYTKPSDRVDSYLYFLIPTVISFGLGISLISIVSFAMHRNQGRCRTSPSQLYLTSKNYLFAQSIANCAFQVVTSTILITNYYEKRLIDSYFQNNKDTYFSLKCFLNITYNVLLYIVIWLFVIGAFDYCVLAIKKLNLIGRYSKRYRQMFERLLATHQLQNLRQNQHSVIRTRPNQLKTTMSSRQHHHQRLDSRTRCSSSTSYNEYHHLHPHHHNQHHPHQPTSEAIEFISMDELNQPYGEFGGSDGQQHKVPATSTMITSPATNCRIETDRIFCKAKTVYYSIFSVVFFSLMLVFPQLFAYEIKQNEISLSPSPMPTSNKALESMANYENFYFVESDDYSSLNNKSSGDSKSAQLEHLKEEYLFRLLNKTSLSYSDTVGRAMAFSVRIDRRDKHVRELLAYMHKTHKRFFTQTGFFNLVSKEHSFCNIIKNSLDAAPIIVRPAPPRLTRRRRAVLRFDETAERVEYFNLTLTCIKKSDLNSYLAYNTLYFWLEHTMVISVPFCVNLVVISSLIYTFLTFTKLQTNQYRLLLKRRKLTKMCKKGISSNRQTLYINEHQLSRKESKKYRGAHKPGSDINILSEEFINELHQLEAYESNLIKKQHDDKNLTLMFILDLFLYFLISFPYTLMRLILDLFVKDQVKISLDFFILFKTSMLAFHVHLIAKFFLMISLNRNFRKSIAWAFSIQNSKCHSDANKDHRHHADEDSCACCSCFRKGAAVKRRRQNSWWLSGSSPTDSYLDMEANAIVNSANMQKDYTSYSLEEENFYHSTEFNSDYHQFYCPAEPNDSDLMPNLPSSEFKNKLSD